MENNGFYRMQKYANQPETHNKTDKKWYFD